MDWINKKPDTHSKRPSNRESKSKKPINLHKQVAAAMAQPTAVWAAALDHALASIHWPKGCDPQATWLWSAVIQEQAEVLVRAGVSARKVSKIIDRAGHPDEKSLVAAVSGLMHQPLESALDEWLEQSDAYPQAALGTIASVWHLPDHARRPDSNLLGDWVLRVTEQILQRQGEPCDCLLGNLVFHCELPLLLDLLTANPRPAAGEVASRAMDDLAEYLENSDQHEEAWFAHGASYLRCALASVFRCRVLADHYGLRGWYPPQRKALQGLLEKAVHWSRHDGSQLLGFEDTQVKAYQSNADAIWRSLCKQSATPRVSRSILAVAGLISDKPARKQSNRRLPGLSYHCELAQCATMRHSWYHRGGNLALDFSESNMQLEAVGPKGSSLLRGQWPVQVALNGQVQYQMDGWEEVCWFSDKDLDYIELEAKFGERAKVQRQLALFRKDRFLFAADALLTECEAGSLESQWTLSSELTLAEGVHWESTEKNTEGFLVGKKHRCLVIPLFLPEWRSQCFGGSLQVKSNQLVITNSSQGTSCVYSPVVIGLNNRLSSRPYTWRQLTVAENLSIVPRDQAAAFRLQLDNQQFLLYRNLCKAAKRTVLGVHLMSDFFAGRIDQDSGEADSLVEIDPV